MMHDKSLHELASLLERGEINSRAIAADCLDRIARHNAALNAFITVDEERLFAEADESDARRAAGKPLSKFDGIPVAVKDNICTKGLRTTCGSGTLRDFVPPYSATAYLKLRERGFITLGKTNMDEFAMGSSTETSFFGPAKNPHDQTKVPGGSSGGSAAAVAARLAPAALGSDTGGSIRQPAAFCGVVGIKPTYGRVSRYGLVAYASSLDQIGAFGRTVDDAAALLEAISGRDAKDGTSIDRSVDFGPDALTGNVKGLVVGVPEEYFQGISPEMNDAVRERISGLEKLGAKIEPVSLRYTEYAVPVYYLIATAEASSNLARYDGVRYGYRSPNVKKLLDLYTETRNEGFGREAKRRIILGTFSLSSGYYDAYYLKALKGRTLIIRDFRQAFEKADVIITPTTITSAFALGEKISDPLQMYMSDILTISANLAALPCLSVPAGKDSAGLPLGLQIMGNHFQERKILDCAKAVESIGGNIGPAL
jgi:aspartyl-tRNA(Asn)/glutamyl-tRNA(Gln) amidotransferase subunit A